MDKLDLFLCYNKYDSSPCHIAVGDEIAHEAESFKDNGNNIDLEPDDMQWLISEGRLDLPLLDCSNIARGLHMASVKMTENDYMGDAVERVIRSYNNELEFFGVFGDDKSIIVPFYYSKIEFDEEKELFYCYKYIAKLSKKEHPRKKEYIIHKRNIKGQLLLECDDKEVIISKDYDDFRSFTDGMCAVHRGLFDSRPHRGWGFVNSRGEEVFPCVHFAVSDFQNGFAIAYKECESFRRQLPVCYVNKSGEIVFQRKMKEAMPFINGFALVNLSEETAGWNYLAEDGTLLLHTGVFSATPFDGDRAEIKVSRNSSTSCIINKAGQVLFHDGEQEIWLGVDFNLFYEFRDFHDGFCVVKGRNGLYGLINQKGETVLEPRYARITDYENGSARVMWGRKEKETYKWTGYVTSAYTNLYGNESTTHYEMVINTKQEIVIQLSQGGALNLSKNYLCAYAISDTMVKVCSDNGFGVVNQYGEEILPCKYLSLTYLDGKIRVYDDCEDTIDYDLSGQPVYPSEIRDICINSRYESAIALRDVYCARKNGKWALLDNKGEQITDFIYYKIRPFDEGNVYANNDLLEVEVREGSYSRLGIITTDGTQLLNCDYEYILSEDNPRSQNDVEYEDYNQYRYITRYGHDTYNDLSSDYHDCYAHEGVSSSSWSVFSLKSRKIIIDGYDCIFREGGFFLAGRGGYFLSEGQKGDIKGYSGVYDLYTLEGELLVGGFSKMCSAGKWIVLLYDVIWKEHSSEYGYESFEMIVQGSTRWLVIDSDLNILSSSILKEHSSIKKGTIINITESKGDGGRIIHKYDFPLKYFFNNEPKWYCDVVSVSYKDSHYFIRENDGKCSPGYASVQPVDKQSVFFVKSNNKDKHSLGLFNIKAFNELTRECAAITYPEGKLVFSMKEFSEGLMKVEVVDITNGKSLTVIDSVNKQVLHKYLNESKLLILNEPQSVDDEIDVLDVSIFDENNTAIFRERTDSEQRQTKYWETVDLELRFAPIGDEDDEAGGDDEMEGGDTMSTYDNPYYNEGLDLDQQSDDFWNEF